jgi:hypothetical protein
LDGESNADHEEQTDLNQWSIRKVGMSTTGWTMVSIAAWKACAGGAGGAGGELRTRGTRATLLSTLATESSDGGGGDKVDDEDDGDAGDKGDADAEEGTKETENPSVDARGGTEAFASSRSGLSKVFAEGDTIDSDAAVTSWVKFAGPLACAAAGLSCLVDHCRRC